MKGRRILACGAVLGGIAVAVGAFGAHMLRPRLSERMMEVFETGVRYHMFHSLAIMVAGWAWEQYERDMFRKGAWAFGVGVALFSGSLYGLAISEVRWLGAVTPLGGLSFLAGWVCLAVGFLRNR